MRQFRRILLVVAVLFSLILSFAVYVYLERQSVDKPVVEAEVKILVAAEDIPALTEITNDMVIETTAKDARLFSDAVSKREDIVGKFARNAIFKGEAFRSGRLLADLTQDISLKLPETFRAMSITVSQASGVSDLVKVGDWVDIIVWLPEIKQDERIIRPNIAKTVLQRVEVLAVNRKLARVDQFTDEIVPSYTLTLAVQVFDAEKIVLAQTVGSLYVTLRPYDSTVLFPTPGVIWEDLLADDFGRIKDLFPQYQIDTKKVAETAPVKVEKYQYYTVVYGDTLRKIAVKFYGDDKKYTLIKDVNQIEDENIIFPGMALKIPILSNK